PLYTYRHSSPTRRCSDVPLSALGPRPGDHTPAGVDIEAELLRAVRRDGHRLKRRPPVPVPVVGDDAVHVVAEASLGVRLERPGEAVRTVADRLTPCSEPGGAVRCAGVEQIADRHMPSRGALRLSQWTWVVRPRADGWFSPQTAPGGGASAPNRAPRPSHGPRDPLP